MNASLFYVLIITFLTVLPLKYFGHSSFLTHRLNMYVSLCFCWKKKKDQSKACHGIWICPSCAVFWRRPKAEKANTFNVFAFLSAPWLNFTAVTFCTTCDISTTLLYISHCDKIVLAIATQNLAKRLKISWSYQQCRVLCIIYGCLYSLFNCRQKSSIKVFSFSYWGRNNVSFIIFQNKPW